MIADERFLNYAAREIAAIAGAGNVVPEYLGASVSVVKIGAEPEGLLARLREADPVFISMLIPVIGAIPVSGTDIDRIADALPGIIGGGHTFRIEAVKAGAHPDVSAKGIEVAIGERMERNGFRIDLASPEVMVYLILEGGRVLVASARACDTDDRTIDHFRLENRSNDRLNRSELKLKEAFAAFGIGGAMGRCLDVGAAPGGWTDFLARRGSGVVAIDAGLLDYRNLRAGRITVVEKVGGAYLEREFSGGGLGGAAPFSGQGPRAHDVVHLKGAVDDFGDALKGMAPFDLACIDMNVAPMESAGVAVRLAELLVEGSPMVMTIKLTDISYVERLDRIREALSARYSGIRIKKLPHNRMELTLFAVRSR